MFVDGTPYKLVELVVEAGAGTSFISAHEAALVSRI